MSGDIPGWSRRKVLATSAAATSGLFTGYVRHNKNQNYAGFAYDAKTHTAISRTSAELSGNLEELRGVLRIGDYKISLDSGKPNKKTAGPTGQTSVFTASKTTKQDPPLFVKIYKEEGSKFISGYITKQIPPFGKLGFVLGPDSSEAPKWAEKRLNQRKEQSTSTVKTHGGIPIRDVTTRVTSEQELKSLNSGTGDSEGGVSATNSQYRAALAQNSEEMNWDWPDYNDTCGTNYSTNGEFQVVVHADSDNNGQGADEVLRGGENNWVIQSYFPDRLTKDRVTASNAEKIGIETLEFHAQIGSSPNNPTYEAIEMNSPTPNDNEADDGYILDSGFTVSGGIDLSPVPFLSAGIDLNADISFGPKSEVRKGYNFNDTQWNTGNYFYWDLGLDQKWTEIPKKPNDGEYWQVNFDVAAFPSAKDYETIVPKSKPNMYFYAYKYDSCPSAGFGFTRMFKEGPLVSAPNTFECKDPY
jgi:hypothetical protein